MITKTFKFENGDSVMETITGFKGTITGTCFYLTGCNQYLVTARAKNEYTGAKALWYDESRLKFIDKLICPHDMDGDEKGCDIVPNEGMRGY